MLPSCYCPLVIKDMLLEMIASEQASNQGIEQRISSDRQNMNSFFLINSLRYVWLCTYIRLYIYYEIDTAMMVV